MEYPDGFSDEFSIVAQQWTASSCPTLVAAADVPVFVQGRLRGVAATVELGLYPIVTLEKQLLNMIGNLV